VARWIRLIISVLAHWIPVKRTHRRFHPKLSTQAQRTVSIVTATGDLRVNRNFCRSVVFLAWPNSPGKASSATVSCWFRLSRHDPALFVTSLCSAMSHERLYWHTRGKVKSFFRPGHKQIRGNPEFETIKKANNAIQSPTRPLSDAILLNVGSLANNSGD
jgi:hypothetical protein